MLHLFLKSGAWFAPKRYGYGAGLPIAWQGWALVASWITALAGIGLLAKSPEAGARIAAFVLFVTVTAMFLLVAARRTRGGWRWCWGSGD
jgi:hypothetical protein